MRIIQQAAKFGLVGLVNTLITLIVIALLTWANVSPWIANAVGYAAGLINSYYGNLLWTFAAPPSNSNKLKFLTSFAIAYAINIVFLSISLPLTEINAMVPQILSMVAYTLTFFVLSKFWVFKKGTKLSHTSILPFFIISAIALAYAIYYVRHEDMIYFWDARGYWQEFNNSSTILANSLYDYSLYLINSIRASDYNASSIILTTPFGILLGTSRVVYISTLVGLYLIPLCGLLAALINFIDANVTTARKNFLIWFIIAVSYPSLWFPTLRGAPDIVGLIPFVAAIWLITKYPTDRIRLWPYIFLGLLLWMPFLFRRWYVYSVLALCITSPFLSVYLSSRQEAFKKALFFTVINYAFSALILVTCILVVQTEFVRSIIQNTYSEEFASYQVPFAIHLRRFVDYFGVINLAVIALSIVSCFLTPRYVPFLLFGLSNLSITILLFTRMQAFDVHHYLPVSFWCLYLTCLTLAACTSRIKNSIVQSILLVTLSFTFLSLSAASAIIAWNFEKPFIGALPSSAAPYHVANVNNYQLLTDKLLELTADGEKVSVFASSAKLNDSMLLSLSREKLTGKLAPVTPIDLRTGIGAGSLLTRYAVVTNPAQTHLPTGQNIVTITNAPIIEGKGIGQAYRPISKDFKLDGMTATIYEKVRSFTHDEVKNYLETIFRAFPYHSGSYPHDAK